MLAKRRLMETNKTTATKSATRNELQDAIEEKMELALVGWKEELGEKRFRKRIKKASKLFGKKLKHGFAKATLKKEEAA